MWSYHKRTFTTKQLVPSLLSAVLNPIAAERSYDVSAPVLHASADDAGEQFITVQSITSQQQRQSHLLCLMT